MHCTRCGRKAGLVCQKCGAHWCVDCHKAAGKVGFFSGKCGNCGGKVVVQR